MAKVIVRIFLEEEYSYQSGDRTETRTREEPIYVQRIDFPTGSSYVHMVADIAQTVNETNKGLQP